MPNTLAHIGAQLPLFRRIAPMVDPRWVALGLLIPDLPWILQRLLGSFSGIDPIDLRAYVVSMSTPLLCLVLSASLCLPFQHRWRIFSVLSIHCLLHLLLDAAQAKAGAGVLFFAPIHWQTYQAALFSMDGWVSALLTLAGAITLLSTLGRGWSYPGISLDPKRNTRTYAISMLLALFYLVLPAFWMNAVEDANVDDLRVWRAHEPRTGKIVHLDRVWFTPGDEKGSDTIRSSLSREAISIRGIHLTDPALISTRAMFLDETTLVAETLIIHPPQRRLMFTLIGLAGVTWIWLLPLLRHGSVWKTLRILTPNP